MGVGLEQGLKIGELWVGSIYADTVSGAAFAVGAGEVGFAELADSAVSGTKVADGGVGTIGKIFAGALDADTHTLSSGSRWVAFRSAFAAPPFVVAGFVHNARTAAQSRDGDWIGAGSVAAGSFLAVGSPGAYDFNWIAAGSR